MFREDLAVEWLGVRLETRLVEARFGTGNETLITFDRQETWGTPVGPTLVETVTTVVKPSDGEVSGLKRLALVRAPNRSEIAGLEAADSKYLYVIPRSPPSSGLMWAGLARQRCLHLDSAATDACDRRDRGAVERARHRAGQDRRACPPTR